MSQQRIIEVGQAPQVLQVNDNVTLIYPDSRTQEPATRFGRVEKINETGVLVELANGTGFRTFTYGRIIGDITIG